MGPVGGVWARWNTPQVGRYPVLGDIQVIKVGDFSTPKVCHLPLGQPSTPNPVLDRRNPNLERGVTCPESQIVLVPQGQPGTQALVSYLTVARELDQLQGATWAQRGPGAWGEEQAGTLVA